MNADTRAALMGAFFAIAWTSAFVVAGAVWSLTHTDTLNFANHVTNGFVFTLYMSLASVFVSGPASLLALSELSFTNRHVNFRIFGFVLVNLTIIIMIWGTGPKEFVRDPVADRIIDRVLDWREELDGR